jgi:RNA polymerase sigma-70 factor (ECF subfamily)
VATPDITVILQEVGAGRRDAASELLPLVYEELRRLAGIHLRREVPGHTLQPTALVHEAYLRMVDQTRAEYRDRSHFYAVAATAMRRILVDHARGRKRLRRGGGGPRMDLHSGIGEPVKGSEVDLEALDDALRKLEAIDPRKVRLVELRFFAGLTLEHASEALGISVATAKRDWAMAQVFLHREVAR